MGFEGAEEGGLVIEARLSAYGSHLDVRLADEQLLGIFYAETVDVLVERVARLRIDAG